MKKFTVIRLEFCFVTVLLVQKTRSKRCVEIIAKETYFGDSSLSAFNKCLNKLREDGYQIPSTTYMFAHDVPMFTSKASLKELDKLNFGELLWTDGSLEDLLGSASVEFSIRVEESVKKTNIDLDLPDDPWLKFDKIKFFSRDIAKSGKSIVSMSNPDTLKYWMKILLKNSLNLKKILPLNSGIFGFGPAVWKSAVVAEYYMGHLSLVRLKEGEIVDLEYTPIRSEEFIPESMINKFISEGYRYIIPLYDSSILNIEYESLKRSIKDFGGSVIDINSNSVDEIYAQAAINKKAIGVKNILAPLIDVFYLLKKPILLFLMIAFLFYVPIVLNTVTLIYNHFVYSSLKFEQDNAPEEYLVINEVLEMEAKHKKKYSRINKELKSAIEKNKFFKKLNNKKLSDSLNVLTVLAVENRISLEKFILNEDKINVSIFSKNVQNLLEFQEKLKESMSGNFLELQEASEDETNPNKYNFVFQYAVDKEKVRKK